MDVGLLIGKLNEIALHGGHFGRRVAGEEFEFGRAFVDDDGVRIENAQLGERVRFTLTGSGMTELIIEAVGRSYTVSGEIDPWKLKIDKIYSRASPYLLPERKEHAKDDSAE